MSIELSDSTAIAENRLTRSQIHTLRERLTVVERRLHDIEMAQDLGALRADIHGDELTEIKEALEGIVRDLNGPNRGP